VYKTFIANDNRLQFCNKNRDNICIKFLL